MIKIATEHATAILPLFIGPMNGCHVWHVNMKALARYQFILFGKQRHIGVNNLPKVVPDNAAAGN